MKSPSSDSLGLLQVTCTDPKPEQTGETEALYFTISITKQQVKCVIGKALFLFVTQSAGAPGFVSVSSRYFIWSLPIKTMCFWSLADRCSCLHVVHGCLQASIAKIAVRTRHAALFQQEVWPIMLRRDQGSNHLQWNCGAEWPVMYSFQSHTQQLPWQRIVKHAFVH